MHELDISPVQFETVYLGGVSISVSSEVCCRCICTVYISLERNFNNGE